MNLECSVFCIFLFLVDNKPVVKTTPIKKKGSSNRPPSASKKLARVKEGYMKKKGGSYKNWKERFFKLTTDHKLSYFENNGDDKEIKAINLRDATKIEENDDAGEWGITLSTKERVWEFRCVERNTRDEWIEEIKKFMPHRTGTIF